MVFVVCLILGHAYIRRKGVYAYVRVTYIQHIAVHAHKEMYTYTVFHFSMRSIPGNVGYVLHRGKV